MINFDRLYYFQRIARLGSIRKAAEELFVSESALSKALHLLEQEMDCELFTRRGKRLQLNENGAFLFNHVDSLIKQAEELKMKLDAHRGVCSQIVMDTFFDFPADIMLNEVLRKHYPDVQFFWKNAVREPMEQLNDLAEGSTDVLIVPVALDDVQRLIPRLIKNEISSIFLSVEHLYLSVPWGTEFDSIESMTVLETRNTRMISAGGRNNYVAVWYEEILASKRKTPNYLYEIDLLTFLKDWENCKNPFVTTSLIVALSNFSSGYAKRHQVRLTDQETERGVFLFYRNDCSPIIELFTSIFKKRFYEMLEGEEPEI